MKEYVFKAEEKSDCFEGTIKIDVPKYAERMKILKAVNLKASHDGVEQDNDNLESFGRQKEACLKYIKDVSLKIKNTGEEINELEELEYYREGLALMSDIFTDIIAGISLGKNYTDK